MKPLSKIVKKHIITSEHRPRLPVTTTFCTSLWQWQRRYGTDGKRRTPRSEVKLCPSARPSPKCPTARPEPDPGWSCPGDGMMELRRESVAPTVVSDQLDSALYVMCIYTYIYIIMY